VDKGISELAVKRSEYRNVLQQDGVDGLVLTLNAKASQLLGEKSK
jgi:ABC-type transporter MlaC component